MHQKSIKQFSSSTKILLLAVIILLFLFLTTTVFLHKQQTKNSQQQKDDDNNKKPFEENNNNAEELAGFGEGKHDPNDKAEIGGLPEKMVYAAGICDQVMSKEMLRHVLEHPNKFRGTKSIEHDETSRKRKRLYFIGDSNALRMFRWTTLFLHFAKFLSPASSEYVTEYVVYNLNTGIFHDRERLSVDVTNNPNRLSKIEFRRAAYAEDLVDVLNDIAKNVVLAEKNFEAVVWISSASWDLLRPNRERHDFTIDTLFHKLYEAKKSSSNNKNSYYELDEAELGLAHDKIMSRWKSSCEKVNEGLISAFGWGSDVDEDHHIRRAMTSRGTFERVTWRFPGPPNCSAPRFHPPRASKQLEFACPFFQDPSRSWWEGFFGQAKESVRPLDFKNKDDHGNDPVFEFVTEKGSLPECELKEDGVHPAHLCVAKESAAYLMRILS